MVARNPRSTALTFCGCCVRPVPFFHWPAVRYIAVTITLAHGCFCVSFRIFPLVCSSSKFGVSFSCFLLLIFEIRRRMADDEAHSPPSKRPASRLGLCAVCAAADARYRCPGCGIVFCSVACSREHKARTGCSGQRDRTAFVPLSDITDTVLASDYVLLEDAQRRKDAGFRALNALGGSRHKSSAMFAAVGHLFCWVAGADVQRLRV